MKKLNLICIMVLICLFVSTGFAKKRGEYATKNLEGQEYYLKSCSSCHGEGSRGGNMASINEWKELFSKNANELILLHEDDEDLISTIKYLKGEKSSQIVF